jgi:MFS family permease
VKSTMRAILGRQDRPLHGIFARSRGEKRWATGDHPGVRVRMIATRRSVDLLPPRLTSTAVEVPRLVNVTLTVERAPRESLWQGPRALVTLSVFALVSVLAFEQIAVATAMPRVAENLDGLSLYGITFAAPAAMAVIAMTLAGAWNDRRGPAVPLAWGTGLVIAGLSVAGAAQTMTMVALGRGVLGLGAGLILVSMYVLIARVYPEAVQARVFTVLTAAWVLPALVGPLLAGWIAEAFGWRWVFVCVIPIVLLAAGTLLAAGSSVGEVSTSQHDASPGDAPHTVARRVAWAFLAAGGVFALTFAADGASGPARILLTVVAAAVVVAAGSHLMPRGVLRGAAGLPSVIAQRGLMGAGFAMAEAWIPLMLTTHRGWSLAMAGWFLTPGALAWTGGSWLAARPHLLRSSLGLLLGPLLLAAGTAFAALGLIDAVPVAVLVVGWSLAGLGMGLTYPVLSVFTLQRSAPEQQGRNSAALQLNESLTSALALSVGGVVFAAIAGAGATVTVGADAAPASSGGLLACFGIAAGLAVLAAAVSRRIG